MLVQKWCKETGQMAKMAQKTNQKKKLGFSNTHYWFITLNAHIKKHPAFAITCPQQFFKWVYCKEPIRLKEVSTKS